MTNEKNNIHVVFGSYIIVIDKCIKMYVRNVTYKLLLLNILIKIKREIA